MILTSGTSINTGDATAMAVHSLPAFKGTMQPIIQNLGPGDLYVSTGPADITSRGLWLPINAVYELPTILTEGAGQVWLAADGDDCDVRIINVG